MERAIFISESPNVAKLTLIKNYNGLYAVYILLLWLQGTDMKELLDYSPPWNTARLQSSVQSLPHPKRASYAIMGAS